MADVVLRNSPQLAIHTHPRSSPHASFTAYILSIACLPDHYAASHSAPSNRIDIFDRSTLRGVQTLSGHDTATTSLHAIDHIAGTSGTCLMSSGKDGSVKIWDQRSNSHGVKMTNMGASYPLLCCAASSDGFTVAAGTDLRGDDARILYWDPRQPTAPLRIHNSTHSDDITVLSFQDFKSSQNNILLSASSDGLISISNADDDDEDEAVIYVGNWGCSVSQAGWINAPSGPAIWAASDMETFSTWSNELHQLQDINIRTPSVHNHRLRWVTDYLITSHSNSSSAPNLGVFVGSNQGDVALISCDDLSLSGAPWALHDVWMGGHVGIVRSVLLDEQNGILVTGGEDSKINVWPIMSTEGIDVMEGFQGKVGA